MRVLIVDEEIIAGGVDTLRRQLVPALAGLVEEIVWVLPAHVADGFRMVENVTIETFGSPGGPPKLKEAVARRIRGAVPVNLVNERLRLLASRHRSDVCMTTCVFGQEIPRVDLPVAGYVSDVNPALPVRIRDNIGRWVEETAVTFAVSDFTASELKRLKPECSHKIQSIPLAAPEGIRPRGQEIRGTFYYPAAAHEHKGHLMLLSAARSLALRDMRYRLILSGPGLDRLKLSEGGSPVICAIRSFLAEHRGLMDGRVVIAGDTGPAAIERLYAEASCVVLPSAYEGFGLPLVEALRYGKRVICSDIAPFREQVARYRCDQLITFVPAGNAAALEEAMAAHLKGENGVRLTPDELGERLGLWTWADAARRCLTLLEVLAGHG